ncbi:hypothetical protein Q3G72_029774 [Acer saccharum]|nr:hypothetical protein Q3G72_029774 [Acer saccharum]
MMFLEAAVTKYDGDGDARYDKDDPCDAFEPHKEWNCNGYINSRHCQKHPNSLEQLSYSRKFRSNEFAKQEKIEGENDGKRKKMEGQWEFMRLASLEELESYRHGWCSTAASWSTGMAGGGGSADTSWMIIAKIE